MLSGRPRLPDARVERIREDRLRPRLTHHHYLHLAALRRGVKDALDSIPIERGPVVDVFCGTQPYRPLVPWRPLWGLDIDLLFGSADVIGDVPLPFKDGSCVAVLCTQALNLRVDDQAVVDEMQRILEPGGYALLTVGRLFRSEGDWYEHHYREHELRSLFSGWSDVEITGLNGIGTGAAYWAGSTLLRFEERWPWTRHLTTLAVVIGNTLGRIADLLTAPLARRWPAIYVVTARRPERRDA